MSQLLPTVRQGRQTDMTIPLFTWRLRALACDKEAALRLLELSQLSCGYVHGQVRRLRSSLGTFVGAGIRALMRYHVERELCSLI